VKTVFIRIDATPPAVVLERPPEGSIVLNGLAEAGSPLLPVTVATGAIEIRASASDATSGVRRVDLLVDGALRDSDAAAPYEFTWEAGDEAVGEHVLEVQAFDRAGSDASDTREVLTVPSSTAGLLASVARYDPLGERAVRATWLPAPPDRPGPLVGAHVHSIWLEHDSSLSNEALAALVQRERLQVASVAIPLGGPVADRLAPRVAERWLDAVPGVPAIVQLNTFRLSDEQQDPASLGELFASIAPALELHPNVRLVVGANEPLTQGRDWLAPEEAVKRVQLEHRLWHEHSALPFCHKFTSPSYNDDGLGWGEMETLWRTSQEAVCYVWYPDTDGASTLERVKAYAKALGKPVHILEAAVPRHDPALLRSLAEGADTLVLYHLVGTGNMDPRFPAWWLDPDGLEIRPAGRMLRDVLGS
jgi:hypothetical protein